MAGSGFPYSVCGVTGDEGMVEDEVSKNTSPFSPLLSVRGGRPTSWRDKTPEFLAMPSLPLSAVSNFGKLDSNAFSLAALYSTLCCLARADSLSLFGVACVGQLYS